MRRAVVTGASIGIGLACARAFLAGGDAVVAAVKRCWFSLFSERAISYRMRKVIAPGRAQMAVIVQRQIEPEAVGVAFSVDPVLKAAPMFNTEGSWGHPLKGRTDPAFVSSTAPLILGSSS
jgi:hypothetical protein